MFLISLMERLNFLMSLNHSTHLVDLDHDLCEVLVARAVRGVERAQVCRREDRHDAAGGGVMWKSEQRMTNTRRGALSK